MEILNSKDMYHLQMMKDADVVLLFRSGHRDPVQQSKYYENLFNTHMQLKHKIYYLSVT